MTLHEEIDATRSRIAKAEYQRDTWRASGLQEKYLEAFCLVEALELQLEALLLVVASSAPGPAPQ